MRPTAFRKVMCTAVLTLALLATPLVARADTATVYGLLSNFDVVNNLGQEAHGFEVQLEGSKPGDILYTFSYQRYGAPTVVPYATGVYVRWTSPYDPATGQFTEATVPHLPNSPFAGTCYLGLAGYDAAGCEHFGVHLSTNAKATTYRWLVADPLTPGALVAIDPPVAIPGPVWTVTPPARVGEPPALVAEVQPAEPAEVPTQYGNAQWVKVFKTEMQRAVALEELLSDDPVVPVAPAQVEVAWDILQAEPPLLAGNQRRHQNQGGINHGTRSVIRRYELYQYRGAYDPITHKVVCGGDGTCSAPLDGELGDYLGAQMAAANVEVNAITVTSSGSGSVASSDKVLSCGSKCFASYNSGTQVTLTASPASGTAFAGWTGACTGSNPGCTVTIDGDMTVGATFSPTFTMSIGRSGKGSVVSTQPGISCPGTCSAKFIQGATVGLTATPDAGGQFVSWSGDCSGTAPTCSVTITRDTKVQANFK